MTLRIVLLLLPLSACRPTPQSGATADSVMAVQAAPAMLADSLVLRGPGGVEVWFTDAREATSPEGDACLERALEIRTDSTHRGVPLLYTREAPTLLGEDAIRAVLYNNCTAGAAYRVDFATVSPKRLTP